MEIEKGRMEAESKVAEIEHLRIKGLRDSHQRTSIDVHI